MNIFWLDNDLRKCAEYHIDKHVCKIPTEVAQMMVDCFHATGQSFDYWKAYVDYREPYEKTNPNHPICKWMRKNATNFYRSFIYGEQLCLEYTHRYGKEHKARQILNFGIHNFHSFELHNVQITREPQCMPEKYKRDSVVEAYRAYYVGEKYKTKTGKRMDKWTKRERPYWFGEI